MATMDIWIIINRTKATIPRKCRLRATWRPLKIRGYCGNRAPTAGDIAAPVTIMNGPSRNTTPKLKKNYLYAVLFFII
ncbi:MAG: hypothetical protein M3Y53_07260 [Thermoproteota archaeon]|nr:hypothetical protein [Thermoproteota archaeon]